MQSDKVELKQQILNLKDSLYRWEITEQEYLKGMAKLFKEFGKGEVEKYIEENDLISVPDISDEGFALLALKNPELLKLKERFNLENCE